MRATRVLTLACCLGVAAPLTAAAAVADPTKGARYLDVLDLPAEDSRDDTVRLKVSRNGKRLDFVGPHERCGGFNPIRGQTYPEIDDVRIRANGAFRRSREYEVQNDTGSVTLMWTVTVRGRFTSARRAKGTVEYELKTGGERSQGEVRSCGEKAYDFTARRGAKYPGLKPPPN